MSEISTKIDEYVSKISGLKKSFMQIYQSDPNKANEILSQMRIYHGYAIYEDILNKEEIFKNKKLSDSEWIRLSSNASFLHIMHSHIRNCQLLLYKFTNSGNYSGYSNKSSDIGSSELRTINSYNKHMNITIKKNNSGLDTISIENINSDTESPRRSFHVSEIFTTDDQKNNKTFADLTTNSKLSDYIKYMNTSEANRLEDEYDKNTFHDSKIENNLDTQNKKFEINKPTIINFWADWCGYSKRFMPNWRKFEEDAKKKFPELQITDLNVGKNNELDNIAKIADVTGYPTVVFFNKGKKHNIIPSNMSVADLNQFVTNHI